MKTIKKPMLANKFMCMIGLHYSGTTDGGSMCDAMRCDVCGQDKYPEAFKGVIINRRSLADPTPIWVKPRRTEGP